MDFGLTEEHRDDILAHFMDESERSQWTLANAVTRTAKDCENPDNQIELEEVGSKIAVMPESKLLAIIQQR